MDISFDVYKQLKYFQGLDGIRALSAFMVISHHMEDKFLVFLDGKSGVSIFFVLSGFLITSLLIREEEENPKVSLRAFYIRRSFRIFPIYYCVLCIYCFLIFGFDIDILSNKRFELTNALPYYIFYMNEFMPFGTGAGFGHSWSLGIEEKFYLLWPLIGFVLLTKTNNNRLLWLIVFSITLVFMDIVLPNYHLGSYYMLLVGCMLAVVLSKKQSYEIIIRTITSTKGTYIVVTVFIITHLLKQYYDAIIILYPIAVALLIALVVTGNNKLTSFLDTSMLRFCGRISYGIYLLHVLSINAVQYVLKPGSENYLITTLTFIFSVLLSIVIAYILHNILERPFIMYGRKIAFKYAN